jgi:hypothetical protein
MTAPQSNDAHEEFISSLVFPYLSFLFALRAHSQLPLSLEEIVLSLFKNLTAAKVLRLLKQDNKA